MAEGESVKLFVSQVPKKMTVAQLFEVFREFALVDKVEIMRDKETGASLGCGFVICPSTVEANKAVFACHDKITLPGAYRRLHMKYADGELERLEHKLLVRTLPKTVSRVHMSTLLSKDGKREDVQILRGSGQTSKGCAFMKSETLEQELAAVMESLNVKHKMEQIASEQHQSVYGPLPMSSVPDQGLIREGSSLTDSQDFMTSKVTSIVLMVWDVRSFPFTDESMCRKLVGTLRTAIYKYCECDGLRMKAYGVEDDIPIHLATHLHMEIDLLGSSPETHLQEMIDGMQHWLEMTNPTHATFLVISHNRELASHLEDFRRHNICVIVALPPDGDYPELVAAATHVWDFEKLMSGVCPYQPRPYYRPRSYQPRPYYRPRSYQPCPSETPKKVYGALLDEVVILQTDCF